MLEKSPSSGIYNVADDDPLSTNDLVRTICSSLGKTARVLRVPAGFLRLAAVVGTFLHLPFNRERLSKLTENYVVSNTKIKRALGIEKLPVSVNDGIAATIKSFSKK